MKSSNRNFLLFKVIYIQETGRIDHIETLSAGDVGV